MDTPGGAGASRRSWCRRQEPSESARRANGADLVSLWNVCVSAAAPCWLPFKKLPAAGQAEGDYKPPTEGVKDNPLPRAITTLPGSPPRIPLGDLESGLAGSSSHWAPGLLPLVSLRGPPSRREGWHLDIFEARGPWQSHHELEAIATPSLARLGTARNDNFWKSLGPTAVRHWLDCLHVLHWALGVVLFRIRSVVPGRAIMIEFARTATL